jgi:MFS transporter, PPP family, 3-phenylpropionic acid transporter
MSSVGLSKGISPELRAALYHATVYGSTGAVTVYLAIWLAGRELSTDQIGIINAVPVLAMLAVNVFIGRLADKASDWRQMIIILSLLAGTIPIGLFWVNEFWGILLIWTLCVIPAGSIPPLIDAATLRMTQRNGTDFGFVRAWGTVGYAAFTFLSGLVIAWFGDAAFLPLFLGLSLLRAGLALQLPRFRAPAHVATLADAKPRAGVLREVLKPWFILPLAAFALIQGAHAVLVAFAALVWKEQGIPEGTIGILLSSAAVAEALMLFFWRRVGLRFSARLMILIAAVVTALRWAIVAMSPPAEILFVLQCTHAITYAMGYLGVVQFIANWTSDDIAAEAQGFAFVLQQGFTVIALLSFGNAVAVFGAHAFFISAALGVVAMLCVWLSLRLKPAKDATL